MFENFPYTDIHQLNLDWIANVAKNFLDQYTGLQQMIADGETSLSNKTAAGLLQLQNKADALEAALNAWYIEHSSDIAGVLASAISDFRIAAEAIAAEVEASLPEDYTELTNAFDSVTEDLTRASVTPTINNTAQGVTREYSSGKLKVYGTATAARRLLFLNGQNELATTSSAFKQTLPAGTYKITSDMTGAETTYNIEYTYDTFSNARTLVRSAGPKDTTITFTAPVMIGFTIVQDRNYGTEESPSLFEFAAEQLTAIDFTSREWLAKLNEQVDAYITTRTVNFDVIPASSIVIPNAEEWVDAAISRGKVIPIPANALGMVITAPDGHNSPVACLKTYAPVLSDTPDYSTDWARTTINAGTTQKFTFNDDCNYLYITSINTSGEDITPTVTFTLLKSNGGPVLYPVDVETNDETGKTDRADEIQSLLNTYGICYLMPGVYYVSGDIEMPYKTSIVGANTNAVIKLLDSIASGSTIYMTNGCTLKDVTVKGKASSGSSADNSRNGVEWTGDTLTHGTIENCIFINFDGAGIYLHDTSVQTYRNLAISDCYITGCRYGIDIRKNSEFNRINNCTIVFNYYGIRNRGGNNNISNCGIDSNTVGIQIDNTEGNNTGHGAITGCSINHSGSNSGYGIRIEGTGRMIVSNCNLYYSKILLNDTNGNVFTGCGFGSDADWEITDGECNIFNGCMVKSWDTDGTVVTITNNTDTKIVNCFDRNGIAAS